jgi:hypothetical protein
VILKLFLALLTLGLSACQTKPTVIKQETINPFAPDTVMVDTRSAFEFAGFHVSGSVHLSTGDYLILKNAKTQTRVMDPDVEQTVERLAKRGLSPFKSVVLISDEADSIENKKWNWLLNQLDIKNVMRISLDDFRRQNKNLIPHADPEDSETWPIPNKALILQNADACFVNWSESDCK